MLQSKYVKPTYWIFTWSRRFSMGVLKNDESHRQQLEASNYDRSSCGAYCAACDRVAT